MAHITKRQHKDGSWAYRIKVYRGKDPATGKQLTPYTMTWSAPPTWSEKKADKEAEKQAALFEDKCKNNQVSTARKTFYDYSEYVIQLKESKGVKHNTIRIYNDSRNRVLPYIGHLKMPEITARHLNQLYTTLLALPQKRDTSKTLSPKTVLEDHRFISTVCTQALKEGIITSNPAAIADKPIVRKKPPRYYQQKEVIAIAEALEKVPLKWKMFTHLLLITGARRGEIGGLRWNDVDWDNSMIHIVNNLLYTSDKGVYAETTKEDRPHFVKLPHETMELLKQYKHWYQQLKLKNGDRWNDTEYIFVQDSGKPMHPTSITTWLSRFSEKNPDLPHLNPHAFRHTHASLLYFAKTDPIAVSERLGHAQTSTTQNFYAHIIQEADEIAAECVAEKILPKRNNKSS